MEHPQKLIIIKTKIEHRLLFFNDIDIHLWL